MAAKRRGLGRGLDALLSPASAGDEHETGGDRLREIPVDQLRRGKYQPRLDMRSESLEELAVSIKAQGVVQPIVVRPISKSGGEHYEIIAGERRWRATQMAGLESIPAVVRHVDDKGALAVALIENIQRENLNPLEEAKALARLVNEFDLTHQQAAEAVGRSRAAVSNLLRLLDLGDDVKELLAHRELEMGHARALLSLGARKQQFEVANIVVQKGLSVRETEALVKRLLSGDKSQSPAPSTVDPDIRKLESDLADKLGAKVRIQHTAKGKGKLVVAYNSLDELDGILDHIS